MISVEIDRYVDMADVSAKTADFNRPR